MKKFYIRFLQILLWVLGSIIVSDKATAQYTSSVLETGKFYTAIAKDNLDNIYIAAYNSATDKYQVLKYTNGTGTPTAIYQGLSYASEYPWSIAVNSAGDVFVMDPDAGSNWRIIKLAAGTYTSSVIQTGRFFTGLTVDNSNNLLTLEYDAATTNYRVVKYAAANLTGAGTTIYNGLPLAVGSGTYPWGIVTDHSNNIYITDFPNNSFNGRLIKLTYPGYAATTLGSGKGYSSLAIDDQDNLYTTESTSGTAAHVMKYTAPVATGAAGTEIFNGLTIGSLSFYPWGIAVNSHGDVFVDDGASTGSGRVIKLTPPSISVSSVTKVGSSPTNSTSVQYTVTFSGTATGVTTTAFSLTTSGSVTGASISGVTGSGTTYTVTVNTGTGDGTLRLNVTGTDMGNTVSNVPFTTGEVYTIDKTAPTGTLTINSGATLTNATAVTLGITTTGATQMRFSTDNVSFSAYEAVAATKAFTLPAGDGLKTVFMQLTDAAGNTQTVQAQITLDQTAPTITSIDVPANGIYHLGEGLRFKAHFSGSIIVTGTPTLDITIGGTTRQATYQGGTGTDTLGFLYIVQAGDVDMDGITLAAALTGTVKDAAGNNAVLTLPAVNTTGVLVNTNIPGVAVTTGATSPLNQPFTATITFTEAVTGFVVGDITAANATLSAFQTADNITYTVLVTPTANGTVTIQVPASVAVNVGNNNNTASNILSRVYDGTAPTITSIDVPANGIYHLGEGLRFKAHFSESIAITGSPTLDITIGGTTRQATYQGGTGTDTLGFLYIVQAGDLDMDGITLAAALTGTVKDAAGNNAVLTLPAVNTTGVLVNTNIPGVAVTTGATSPLNQPFTATITFTEAVTGFVVGDITVTNATLSAFQTADNITYTVLVTPTADGTVTIQVPASVAVNVGNNNNTASNILSRVYDGTAPTITSIDVPANGIYHLSEGLRFKAHFSESIALTGSPTLDITIGGTTRQATYQGGSGTDTLGFLYVVQAGDVDMDGITLAAALTGTVKDAAGNNAVLTLPAVNTTGVLVNTNIPGVAVTTGATSPLNQPFTATITFTEAVTGFVVGDITTTNATLSAFQTADNITYTVLVTPTADGTVTIQVPASVAVNVGNNNNTASNILSRVYDGTAPTITSIDVPANGIYHLGEGLRFKAHFSESIAITGSPTLDITIGGTTRQATYQGGTGTDTLGFLYIVQAGDVDMDGITLAAALTGTVKDAAGNTAVLTLPAVNTTGVLVNTNIPGVAVTTGATSPLNQPFTATITFTEAVTGFVVGDITATNAMLSAFQTADNITYTVLVTPTADGTVTIQVPASVAVNVGNNNNTASNILSRVYDGTAPTITSIDVPANGIYHLGEGLRFKAHFSESITVTGTPTLDITIGGTTHQATYQGGTGTDTLGFLYIVQAGDLDMDGITLAAALTGTVKDAAGNNAVLTLPAVNTTGVLVNTNIPGVAVTTGATSPLNQPFTATITFTEAVTGFVVGDITTTNATLSAFQTADNMTYTVLVTPTTDGTVTIQVPASVAVNVGNNNNTASNILSRVYDGTAPTITSIDVPANGIYYLGEGLRFKAHFSESITVTGTPTLDITIGGTTRQATYQGGTGTDTLGFLYIVQAGDVDMDGITLGAALTGIVKDAAGNNAVLTLPAVNTTGVLVNTNIPGVAVTTGATSPLNQPFTATITFTEAVTGFVVGDITTTNATLSAFQTADNMTYTVLVTPTTDGTVTIQVPSSVAVNVGNNNNTASNILSRVYDGTAPTITSIDVPANGIYHLGEGLRFKAHFSESITVTGTPTLDITIGGTTRQATYQGGNGTDTLGFLYIVQAGDVDMDGITLAAALTGTVKDAAGNNAVLTLPAVNTTGVLVNTNIPGVAVTTGATSPLNQPFTATITFTEAVAGFVVGDITTTNATLSAFQTADNMTYTVLVTPTANGTVTIQVPASVAVNVGNNNNTASNILSRVYDGTAPTITSIDVPANGIYHLGEGLRFKAHFSESIAITGTPTLDITIGGTTRQATYQGGTGTDTLGFLYVVQAGDLDMDGITLAAALTGTVKDAAGNNAVLTLPAVNTTGVLVNTNIPGVAVTASATSPLNQPFTATITFTEAVTGFVVGDITAANATLSAFQTADNITYTVLVTPTADGTVTIQVPASVAVNVGNNPNTASNILSLVFDGTAPVVTAVDVPANAVYNEGQVLSFTVHFSEIVNVTGT
ncbi:Ig-like domain-containing protein, partial [Chitinophaga sp. RAB17]|uniref:Ig-like domain-containing protein n=1 Tax=Chitinophaga sp. RAB17 TaxID=3233049 RepID=UPI003F8F1F5C